MGQQAHPDIEATTEDRGAPATAQGWRKRDLYLLPGIFLLTWLCLGVVGEAMARIFFPEQQQDVCHVTEATGGRFKANCQSRIKMFESGWIDNSYNDCGYRSAASCKAPAAGALRVAVLGTSISRGYWVSYDQSFAGRVERDLTKACGRPVDLQNVSQADSILVTDNGWIPIWHHIADRVPEALRLHPKALVLVMTAFDLASYDAMPGDSTGPRVIAGPPSLRQELTRTVKTAKDFLANESRLVLLARHFAYRDADRYALHELGEGDSSDYLRQPFTGAWLLRLKVADATLGRVAAQARTAGVPLIVVMMPPRVQAALSAPGADRHHTDPFALGRALSAIVRSHGGHFVDMTTVTGRLPDAADLYFPVNGHPNAAGHALLATAVQAALVRDVPSFAGCRE